LRKKKIELAKKRTNEKLKNKEIKFNLKKGQQRFEVKVWNHYAYYTWGNFFLKNKKNIKN
jgi:hypothetical protein